MRLLIVASSSPRSEVAVRLGAEIAQYTKQAPTVLVVIEAETDRPEASVVLATGCELLLQHVTEVETVVRVGHPAEEIIREIEEGEYDLVIVGENGRDDLITRVFQGSTARRVVDHAPCPVIVAKGGVRQVRRILLCDSGADSRLLMAHTARLANLIDEEVEITVLHVMSQISAGPGVNGQQLRATAEQLAQECAPEGELLARDIEFLEQSRVHPRPKVRHGTVVEEILEEAHSEDYDLVVIGAHRGEGWGRFLLDDLARRIVEKIDIPVMVVK